ncbi:hypothetical protein [Streptomyces pseudovenezuelae]|uniref:Integral membrane protein n=1 Tax=Streptomyces pseudovenezuelae TaxID=67350 RepID=A0ABT6LUB9_9ACTN|nr:hypothetical protein [Streptomyces pseudovenezuelae]MDH6219808.1 hypothetical protein [Streptomyces pseudovenezuelae]
MRSNRSVAAVLCALAVLLLAACGTEVAGRGSVTATATGPIPWTVNEPARVTAARLAADHRTLSVEADVPDGKNPCVRGLKAEVTQSDAQSVRVQLTFSTPSGDRRSGCTEETTATARVRLPQALGGQHLVVDLDTVFTTEGAKLPALRLCGQLGCDPPATGCSAGSYDQALMAVGAPAHTYRDAEHCDGKWLVLDFSWRTGPVCGGDDAQASGCASRLGDRFFFRATKAGWKTIARSSAGGCTDVLKVEPAFPTALCASLAPLDPALHPSYPPASASPTATATAR